MTNQFSGPESETAWSLKTVEDKMSPARAGAKYESIKEERLFKMPNASIKENLLF